MEWVNPLIEVFKSWGAIAGLPALLIAGYSAYTSRKSYALSHAIQQELKGDEILLSGVLAHPELRTLDHQQAVLQTTVFNKSKRKCAISRVEVFDRKGQLVDADWSSAMDELGMPQNPTQLLGVVDDALLSIRRRDGLAGC